MMVVPFFPLTKKARLAYAERVDANRVCTATLKLAHNLSHAVVIDGLDVIIDREYAHIAGKQFQMRFSHNFSEAMQYDIKERIHESLASDQLLQHYVANVEFHDYFVSILVYDPFFRGNA